jgi:hypothetical protein
MQPEPSELTYSDLLDWTEGLPPDAPSVKWVHNLDPESPVSKENSILIPAQARLDHRKLFEQEGGLHG